MQFTEAAAVKRMPHTVVVCRVLCLFLPFTMLFSIAAPPVSALAAESSMNALKQLKMTEERKLRVSVISDVHLFPKSMIDENSADYIKALNSDRKMFSESEAILDGALQIIGADKPDVLLIAGDLTKDGELKSAKILADKLSALQQGLRAQGTDTEIYLVPGNHDVNNRNAKDYSSGTAVDTDRVTPENFKEIFAEFGFANSVEAFQPAPGKKAGGLSYVERPRDGFTVIAIDTCKYSADATAGGKDIQETGGSLSADLLGWIKSKAGEARDRGDTVIAMSHHGLVPHFDYEPVVFSDYLVDDYVNVSEQLHEAGITYIFTGHMHANDIAALSPNDSNTLYDFQTGSLVTYPSPLRLVEISNKKEGYKIKETLAIKTKYVKEIEHADPDSGERITDLAALRQEENGALRGSGQKHGRGNAWPIHLCDPKQRGR